MPRVVDFDTVKSTLTTFSVDHLRQVRVIVDALLASKAPNKKQLKSATNFELFYTMVADQLQQRVGLTSPTAIQAQRFVWWSSVQDAYNTLEALLRTLTPTHTTAHRLRLWWWYVNLIVEYLQEINVPVGIKILFTMHNRFPGLLDQAFPGYVGSGLLLQILEAKTATTEASLKERY